MSGAASGGDVFLKLSCYVFYAWCASRFLKIGLQGKLLEEKIFGGLLFCSYGVLFFFFEGRGVPYIFYAMCSHGTHVGLAMAVFKGEKEKKLLAAVLLVTMTSLFWNFGESFLSLFSLIGIHAIAGEDDRTVLGMWSERVVICMTYGTGISIISCLSKPFAAVLEFRRKSWYLCLTVPLLCMVFVTDFVNWAASNGISLGGNMVCMKTSCLVMALCVSLPG